jgi:hypothetical protein
MCIVSLLLYLYFSNLPLILMCGVFALGNAYFLWEVLVRYMCESLYCNMSIFLLWVKQFLFLFYHLVSFFMTIVVRGIPCVRIGKLFTLLLLQLVLFNSKCQNVTRPSILPGTYTAPVQRYLVSNVVSVPPAKSGWMGPAFGQLTAKPKSVFWEGVHEPLPNFHKNFQNQIQTR